MIHFFEIVSTLLLAFYISYLLMTNCSEFGKCSTVKKYADHLMPDCLQKAFDFNVFRDMHHFSRDNRSLETCRFTLHYSRIMRIRN